MSRSMSGGPSRPADRNRSNSSPCRTEIDAGDPQRVADRRVRRRATALAQDALLLAEPDDVVHDQEVTGEAQLLDDLQLAGDLGVGAGDALGVRRAVALLRVLADQRAQPGRLVVVVRDGEVGQRRRDHVEVERAVPGQPHGAVEDAGVPAQPVCHLRARPEVGAAGGGQPAVHLVEAAAGPDRGERLGQPGVPRGGVVHVAGGDRRRCRWRRPVRTGRRCARRPLADRGRSARPRRCRGRTPRSAWRVPGGPRPGPPWPGRRGRRPCGSR